MEEKNLLTGLDGVKCKCGRPVCRSLDRRGRFLLSIIKIGNSAPAGLGRITRQTQIENRFRNFLFQKLKKTKKICII